MDAGSRSSGGRGALPPGARVAPTAPSLAAIFETEGDFRVVKIWPLYGGGIGGVGAVFLGVWTSLRLGQNQLNQIDKNKMVIGFSSKGCF